MKKLYLLFTIIPVLFLLFSCRNSGEREKERSTELISTRTLGLAYLEEFKLEEAEKEFLKFVKLAPREKLGYANLGLTYLRMGSYQEAEKQLLEAIKLDPKDADIRLILATVYHMDGQRDRAVSELREALTFAPDHIKVLYDLSELYSAGSDEASRSEQKNCLLKLVDSAPANLVPKLNLTAMLITDGEVDKALEQLEIVRKQFPEFPKESVEYYNNTISLLNKKDLKNAQIQFTIFHNYLKVTPPYQAGMMDLKGPGGSLIGFPLITFDQQTMMQSNEGINVLDALRFTDATSSAGLNIVNQSRGTDNQAHVHVESADYDGDGDIDLYTGSYDSGNSGSRHYLLNNEMGRFTDVTEKAGLGHKGKETAASFSDFDNDGFLDLYIVRQEGDLLYRNSGDGTFEDVTGKSGIGSPTGGNIVLSFDLDHDGDLDLFEGLQGKNLLFRNNADGTFTEQASGMGLSGADMTAGDAAFGDFDEDADIDFIITAEKGGNVLYSNQRQGSFKDLTSESGLKSEGGSGPLAVADFDNDGFLDLFIASSGGSGHRLLRNRKNGTYESLSDSETIFGNTGDKKIHDALFFDFDNDGLADLLLVGEAAGSGERGILLYHNEGKSQFKDLSGLLPADLMSGRQITPFDYNDDGDIDLVIARPEGTIMLLRNDGGNINHFVRIKLVGLKAGSAKNNHFGIGAKVEIRAGDLYQTIVVNDPNVHFGIGNRPIADVIRITWTNGVPQNIFFPATDQSLIEAQILKGSCPFLYTWDGDEFVFAKDVLWRSGLGMPLGIMGGTTTYAFADASDDYIKIPGDILQSKDGRYTIQVTSELWETIYLDRVQLVAVDHPESVDIFVAEQFTPPPFPGFEVYLVKNRKTPVSAFDQEGIDVLSLIAEKDDRYFHGYFPGKYQGITEMKLLELDPGETGDDGELYLFMTGWIFPTDASINVALSQTDKLKAEAPDIQVINKEGNWETVVTGAGFPMGKDKTVIVNLTGKFLSADHRIRIRTNMDICWDYIFFSGNLSDETVVYSNLDPVTADLHYRGFSDSFRKGGRFGPHWFDYSKVSKEPRWRDLTGNYTRYGDVLPLLTASDNKYIISNAGDEATIGFDATSLPDVKEGWQRDFLFNFVGWVKDGDLNTANGNTVLPLPFHGMKSYPPSPEDVYPDDPGLKAYNLEYNSRVVTREGYLNALKGKN